MIAGRPRQNRNDSLTTDVNSATGDWWSQVALNSLAINRKLTNRPMLVPPYGG